MNKNANGFLGITAVLAVVVINLVGGAGYYVFEANNRADNKQITIQNPSENTEKQLASEIPGGYRQYVDGNLSFQYPESWIASRNNSQPEWVFFNSIDYSAQDVGPSTVIQAGYLLEIRVAHTTANESFEQSLKNAHANQSSNGEKIVQIDGHDSLLSNLGSDGSAGAFWVATSFVGGKTYYFRLNGAANTGTETKQVFDSLLAGVRFVQ